MENSTETDFSLSYEEQRFNGTFMENLNFLGNYPRRELDGILERINSDNSVSRSTSLQYCTGQWASDFLICICDLLALAQLIDDNDKEYSSICRY